MNGSDSDLGAGVVLPTIGVMVLNHNGEKWLSPLFDSLLQQSYPGLKIYLVDNASTDSSVSLTRTNYPTVTVFRLSQNAGYCIAYNRTMPIAFSHGCDWIIWANNDLLLEPGCLLEMGRVAAIDTDVGVIGPSFMNWNSDEPNYYMKGKHPQAIEHVQRKSAIPIDVDWVEGSFLMVSRNCIHDVGWLDPLLSFYWEESDFCRRAIRNHWRVVLVPRALARHYGGGSSSGNQSDTTRASYLKLRNQYIYSLADPRCSFLRNVIRSFHLFMVLVKAGFKVSVGAAIYEVQAFLRLIPELGEIWHKWRRDRNGISPDPISPQFANVNVEIVGDCCT